MAGSFQFLTGYSGAAVSGGSSGSAPVGAGRQSAIGNFLVSEYGTKQWMTGAGVLMVEAYVAPTRVGVIGTQFVVERGDKQWAAGSGTLINERMG